MLCTKQRKMVKIKSLSANDFQYLEVTNKYAKAKIALQGAHIFEFTPHDAKEILWLSDVSDLEYGTSIRGGIPICWPWFGMHTVDTSLPQHGFARTALWEYVDAKELADSTIVTMMLRSDTKTRTMFPYEFELTLSITLAKELTLKLTTKNCDTKSFSITQALHTYFNISDISNIEIEGLHNKPYLDALDMKEKIQQKNIQIDKEVDRVFQEVDNEIVLKDKQKTLSIINGGSRSVVVWNPWIEKCSRMSAMKNESYKTFVCVETANALKDAKEIKPQKSHTLQTTISYI